MSDYTVTLHGTTHGFSYTGDSETIRYDYDGDVPTCPHCGDTTGDAPEHPTRAWVMLGDHWTDRVVYCHSCGAEVGKAKEVQR